jgi:dimethylsulfone monooxygenase
MPMRYAYWATNLGGLVFSSVDETPWDFASNVELARAAEDAGFEYALVAARFILTSGRGDHLESLTTTAALAAATRRLKLVTAIHPGLWHPGVVAKAGATIDHVAPGRFAVNVVSGWFRREFHAYGEPWLDHDERYRRSAEFIEVLRGLWNEETFSYRGDFYRIHEAWLAPRPTVTPEIFQGGNSSAARAMAARHSDWYFMNGGDLETVRAQVAEVRALAAEQGRELRFALNAFPVVRDTEEEALAALDRIVRHANADAVRAFAGHVRDAGSSTTDRIGMWASSDVASMVQPNDGFRPGLIGTPAQVAARIEAFAEAGVDCLLCGFLDFAAELPAFGREVIPLVGRTAAA